MRPDIEVVSFFGQVAAALDLTAEEKERAWSMMTKAGVGLSDPTSVYFCVLAKMNGLTADMGEDFKANGRKLIAGVKSAMSDEMKGQLEKLPVSLSEKLDARMEEYIRQLAGGVDGSIKREAARRQTFRLGGFALGAVALAVLALGAGYMVGRDTLTTDAAKWSSVVNLEDGGKWLSLARMNDIDKALAQSCGPSDGRVISGGKVCDLPLFTTQPVSSSKGVDYVRLSAAEYANKAGWLGYGVFALLGVGLGYIWRGRRA
ncbi:hypothetical protein [Agrobacterium tumefaciens]|uniref:hypothetical protein n=1 Tax=Agrobacterium tumefaciens TaxID=358 RepID=UPI0015717067|nr:hypothetical protein [Agrobacterium tumefaciens]